MKSICVFNGPNLNLLGTRETAIYGSLTLEDVRIECQKACDRLQLQLDFRQSNHEGELVDWIHEVGRDPNHSPLGLVLNAAAYTHTSIALHDAIKAVSFPVIEVHLSNVFAREAFRHHSWISPVARGVIAGLGIKGYVLAIEALV